ncbi:alpha/beta hydrolase [Gordonia sp. zg691]|uniref:alpha/beta hydrolase family protein n=1 Tax=Gordonia jinghuaiqii TaxID=2758710 RepID=UPI00166249EA|nr:alpha/beta hydrolase [Gordonia jinghuaiqii]MBD0859941.1 alpha/beta hydrolase [Gordonia jinghuaiqii]
MSAVPRCAVRRTKIEYGCEPSQFGHLYQPRDSLDEESPARIVVLIHGGSWSVEYGSTIQTAVARMLAERGAVVWNIEYRRVGEAGGGWPNTGRDVVDAIRALDGPVREALPARGVDFSSTAVVGHSAGGQLAVWAVGKLGARTESTTITTVVAQAAVLDTVGAANSESLQRFIGRPYSEAPRAYQDASPMLAPVFDAHVVAIHGDDDDLIPVESSRRYVDDAVSRGQSAELIVVPGEGHQAFVDLRSGCVRQTVRVLGI